jgi:crossover junction endodeoxyribonuclease RusA
MDKLYSYTLQLPWAPSVNGYWRAFRGRQILSAKGREYRKAAVAAVPNDAKYGAARLFVELWLSPPDRRIRDLDNYAKAVLDALTHAGVWDDDSQIDRLAINRCAIEKPGRVTVKIKSVSVHSGLPRKGAPCLVKP